MSDSFDVTRYNIANEPTPVFQQLSAHYKKWVDEDSKFFTNFHSYAVSPW